MARSYVTGANGFIGSHLIPRLLARGDEVVGLVRPTSDLRVLEPLVEQYPDRFRLVVGDLCDPASLGAGLAGAEYVYHLAAALMVTSREAFRTANVDGTRHLLAAVERHAGGQLKRVLFTSSMACAGPAPTPEPIDETRTPAPVSWYGESKRDAELVVREFAARGMPITTVRPVGVYGEREDLLARSVFPVVRAGFIPRLGFGRKLVSFVHVADLVEGIIGAAESPATAGRTYFLSNPRVYETPDVPRAVADALGTRVRIPVVTPMTVTLVAAWLAELRYYFTGAKPLVTTDKVRETRQRYWIVSPAAAKRDFGWEAALSLGDGMKRTVDHWRREQDEDARVVLREPKTQRVVKAFVLSTLIGLFEAALDLAVGGITFFGMARAFGIEGSPWWLTVGAITITFAVTMGFVSLWTQGRRTIVQFLGGAAVGFTLEILNQTVVHWWEWNPETFGALQGPWMPALLLGGAAGFYPLVVNAIAGATFRKRLRIGAGR